MSKKIDNLIALIKNGDVKDDDAGRSKILDILCGAKSRWFDIGPLPSEKDVDAVTSALRADMVHGTSTTMSWNLTDSDIKKLGKEQVTQRAVVVKSGEYFTPESVKLMWRISKSNRKFRRIIALVILGVIIAAVVGGIVIYKVRKSRTEFVDIADVDLDEIDIPDIDDVDIDIDDVDIDE